MIARTLPTLAGLLAVAAAAASQDLGSVLAANSDLSTYYSLIQQFPDILLQLPNLNGVTIIAPSNDAIANIPFTALNNVWNPKDNATTISLLQYHILQGSVATAALTPGPTLSRPTLLKDPRWTNVTAGQNVLIDIQPGGDVVLTSSLGARCTVIEPDISFQGGLIHMVDNLLIPPAPLNLTAQAFKLPNFLGALYAADLMPAVQDTPNVTIFAPLDKAMALVGGSLDAMDQKQLARVMGYHVVPGSVLVSSQLNNGTRLPTMAAGPSNDGTRLVVRQFGNNKYVNSALIVQPDILLANGIMHIIADVLNPDASAAVPVATANSQPPVFPVSTVRNPFTSALPCTSDCPVTSTTQVVARPTTTTSFFVSSSKAAAAHAAHPIATGHVVAGAALGMLGVGAGFAWI